MSSYIVSMCNYKVGNFSDVLSTHFLGSCVAIVLYDPKNKIGGLSHSLLPTYNGGEDSDSVIKRYVDKIIPILINEMTELGGSKSNFQAMLFGGSKMEVLNDLDFQIGENNISKSKEILSAHGIPVVEEDSGGKHARSIFFDCSNGNVTLKKAFSDISQNFSFR